MAEEEKAADLRWDWIESRVRNAFKHVKDDSEYPMPRSLFEFLRMICEETRHCDCRIQESMDGG